jgi:hypothetical protein
VQTRIETGFISVVEFCFNYENPSNKWAVYTRTGILGKSASCVAQNLQSLSILNKMERFLSDLEDVPNAGTGTTYLDARKNSKWLFRFGFASPGIFKFENVTDILPP